MLKKVIISNKKYWSDSNKNPKENGLILFDSMYSNPLLAYGVIKISLIIAEINNLKPIGLRAIRVNKNTEKMVKSMCELRTGSGLHILSSFIENSFNIVKNAIYFNSKKDLIDMTVDGVSIGKYIYDSILIAYKLPEIKYISFKMRLRAMLELTYFYYFRSLISKNKIQFIVLADNTYRHGILFELAKIYSIKCICPISLTNFSMRKYYQINDFNLHYRTPETLKFKGLSRSLIEKNLDEYLEDRYQANPSLACRNSANAYSQDKLYHDRDSLISLFNLDPCKKIVVVMAHIFCDAPHAYPSTLYLDYYDWLDETVRCLKQNNNINLLVKEHPSSMLYSESGIVEEVLYKHKSCNSILPTNLNTQTVLDAADIVVTCGGTIGLEFSIMGKPVVLAAAPPYSNLGFTHDFKSKSDYELMLHNIHKIKKLNKKQLETAKMAGYYEFIMMNNYDKRLELGGQRFIPGGEVNFNKMMNEILSENNVKLQDQYIYKTLKDFIESSSKRVLL